jgi:hypothetical protein
MLTFGSHFGLQFRDAQRRPTLSTPCRCRRRKTAFELCTAALRLGLEPLNQRLPLRHARSGHQRKGRLDPTRGGALVAIARPARGNRASASRNHRHRRGTEPTVPLGYRRDSWLCVPHGTDTTLGREASATHDARLRGVRFRTIAEHRRNSPGQLLTLCGPPDRTAQ